MDKQNLKLFLMGAPHLESDNEPVKLTRRKGLALLAYLALSGERLSRDTLATLLWPESSQSASRTNLRSTLTSIKKALGEGCLDFGRETISMPQRTGLWIDVVQYRYLLAKIQAHDHAHNAICSTCLPLLEEATKLYRGDFLAGFTLRDSPAYDEWQFFTANNLRHDFAGVLDKLAHAHATQGDYAQALIYGRRWLAMDPLHEPAHRLLLQLFAWSGQQSAAVRQYRECKRILQEELSVAPEQETRQLFQNIQEGREMAPDDTTERCLPGIKHNLPILAKPLIGREAEMTDLGILLTDPSERLLTIVGPGGVGKTALALSTAHHLINSPDLPFTHGIFLLKLEDEKTIKNSQTFATQIANILAIPLANAPNPEEHLLYRLGTQKLLLFLDNGELLSRSGKQLISRIITNTANIKFMVTSRVQLDLTEERIFELGGLDHPKSWGKQSLHVPVDFLDSSARYSAAVRLLGTHVTRIDARFSLEEATPQTLADMVRLCQLVEGLPLAIELAAAWTQVLTFSEIVEDLTQNLNMLAASVADMDRRHQSIHFVFEQSWSRLNRDERIGLCALAVFHGHFSRQAAKTITKTSDIVLKSLVTKSLLQTEKREGTIQFQMHRLLRQYVEEKLKAEPVAATEIRRRHANYYGHFLASKKAYTIGTDFQSNLMVIGEEIENIRAGWLWAVAKKDISLLAQYSESLAHFYNMRGWPHEGRRMFLAAMRALNVEDTDPEAQRVLMHIKTRLVSFNYILSMADEAEALLRESLAYNLIQEEETELEFVFRFLGMITYTQGYYADAVPYFQKSIQLAEELNNTYARIRSQLGLGLALLAQGDYESFEGAVQLAHQLSEKENHQWGLAHSYRFMGIIAHIQEDYDRARDLHKRSLKLSQQIGDQLGIAAAWNNLGREAQEKEEYDLALELFHKGLKYAEVLPYYMGMILAACNSGMLHLQQESLGEAARSFVVALETALDIKTIPGLMHIFACTAGLLGHASWPGFDQISALQLLLTANFHPTTHFETRRQVSAFLDQYNLGIPSGSPEWLEARFILEKATEVLTNLNQGLQ